MSQAPYSFSKEFLTRYRFFSTGRKRIEKVVEFTPLAYQHLYNLGFGDLLENGKMDDKANSNNGDIIKVLSTVVHIVKDFTAENPEIKIAFTGSTRDRTALYQRIIKTYFTSFRQDFQITALEGPASQPKEVVFDPFCKNTYLAFFIKRIN